MVLKRERVIVIPEGVTFEQLAAARDERALAKLVGAQMCDAWVVCGEFTGGSKKEAIERHTGPSGHPDTLVGDFKAPPATGWAGGRRLLAPPKPLVLGADLED